MAALLAIAAAFVAGQPRRLPHLQRTGAAGVAVALAVRGSCGLAGRTDLISPREYITEIPAAGPALLLAAVLVTRGRGCLEHQVAMTPRSRNKPSA